MKMIKNNNNSVPFRFVFIGIILCFFTALSSAGVIEFENEHVKYAISEDGTNLHFIDKQSAVDYCIDQPPSKIAHIIMDGKEYSASAVSFSNGRLKIQFGDSMVTAVVRVTTENNYFLFDVLSLSDSKASDLTFFNVNLNLDGTPEETFAGCALALNLQTYVPMLPGTNSQLLAKGQPGFDFQKKPEPKVCLQATCFSRFGFEGAKVAIIGCPRNQLRNIIKEVVSGADDLPKSPLIGPWAMDAQINRGSYLMIDSRGGSDLITEKTADGWIRLCSDFGIKQIDYVIGKALRFGDCHPDPEIYPNGYNDVKKGIDKLHSAGISVGLHTYAFFLDKNSDYVTPVPDPRLGKDAVFTLAEPLAQEDTQIIVAEPTKEMSPLTGGILRNSATLQIDDELIVYSRVVKDQPYSFAECQRGAYGTKAATHSKDAKVYHLIECFNLFAPAGDSTLLTELAAKHAEAFNECGFDMLYIDALDGADVLGGWDNSWHYASKFVYEICRRLKKPALIEMSTFCHNLWYARSRIGAWDVPHISHKKFIDTHLQTNQAGRGMFLPTNLGWFCSLIQEDQKEATFPDDLEYMMCKCIGADNSASLVGVTPDNISNIPAYGRLAPIFKKYEELRLSNYFSKAISQKLSVAGDEFKLESTADNKWQFRPIQYAKHKVCDIEGVTNIWKTNNKFAEQPVKLRIETLISADSYDSPESAIIEDFNSPVILAQRDSADGVTADIKPSSLQAKEWQLSGCFTAKNNLSHSSGTWSKAGKIFSPLLNIADKSAIGVWIYGDNQGEILNFQMRNPVNTFGGLGDHYVKIDFSGWQYFELIESEAERIEDYSWPYTNLDFLCYYIYRQAIDFQKIETFSIWCNNLPAGKEIKCFISPIKALPRINAKLITPQITINGKTIAFPAEMERGSYLEFYSMSDCKLYSRDGKLAAEIKPKGDVPVLRAGENRIEFKCSSEPKARPRANVTIISEDPKPL